MIIITAPPKNLHILGEPCICGKRFSFINEADALEFARLSKSKKYSYAYKCNSNTGNWHLTTHGSGKLKNLERELHEEMANNSKTIRQRITDYMWDSYQRHHTTKFSSSMVVFALQQENPATRKPQIMQEISKAKKDGIIVSLHESVPDQKGAVYFTLSRILEEETDPKNVTETSIKKPEVPAQTKPVPVNPFDGVNKKLSEIKEALGNSEITLDEEDFDKLAGKLEERLKTPLTDILAELREIRTVTSTHVTVDGDKLADVINARLQNLKLDDSFIYAVREEVMNSGLHFAGDANSKFDLVTERMQRMADTLAEFKGVPSSVTNSSDYRVGVKDGIRLALEMGLKIDE